MTIERSKSLAFLSQITDGRAGANRMQRVGKIRSGSERLCCNGRDVDRTYGDWKAKLPVLEVKISKTSLKTTRNGGGQLAKS